MDSPAFPVSERRISAALARIAYLEGSVRIASRDLSGMECLVACNLGLYGVSRSGEVRRILYGFFHGIRHHGDHLLLFEIGDRPRLLNHYGRILRIPLHGARIGEPEILVTGLHNRCHQLAEFDGKINLVDTYHQTIPRFTLDGAPIDTIAPFPYTAGDEPEGDYYHVNCIAAIGERIGLMLHNGKFSKPSEVAWFDRSWNALEREPVQGYGCHDIVEDEAGTIWHCGSMDGELINSDGLRHKVTDRMTRGLAITGEKIVVGVCTFGSREVRDNFTGTILFLDRRFNQLADVLVPSAPMDLVLLQT